MKVKNKIYYIYNIKLDIIRKILYNKSVKEGYTRFIMKTSFIHISDVHLGRPFSDLALSTDKFDICNQACEKAFNNMIDMAIQKQVDFILISGDSFDDDEHDLHTKLVFIKGLERLADNGIKSYVVCGNHDPISLYKKYESYFKFGKNYKDIINITGVTTEKNLHCYENGDVNIYSYSFEEDSSSNPANEIKKLITDKNALNIVLTHCDLDKTDSKYGACSREELRELGCDYYALGHIHVPDDTENLVYAGTIQGRTKKETGAHGCYYVELENDGGKVNVKKEFIPVDVVRFNSIDINCEPDFNRKDVFEHILETINSQIYVEVSLNLFEINLIGVSDAYEDLNDSESLIREYIEEYENKSQRVGVYRINNYTTPNIDEKEIKADRGVVGIIANSFEDDSDIDVSGILNNIFERHKNIYGKLKTDHESKEFLTQSLAQDKDEIIEKTKKEILALCKEVYLTD